MIDYAWLKYSNIQFIKLHTCHIIKVTLLNGYTLLNNLLIVHNCAVDNINKKVWVTCCHISKHKKKEIFYIRSITN